MTRYSPPAVASKGDVTQVTKNILAGRGDPLVPATKERSGLGSVGFEL